MKTKSNTKSILAAVCAVLATGSLAFAQDSVVSTTSTVTSDGVVQQFVPTSSQIIVSSTGSTTPIKYTYNKTTTFVDAAGNVVSQESIKQNTPARIYYTKVGENYIVTKFVANPTVETQVITPAAPAPVVEESTSTTTTTTKE